MKVTNASDKGNSLIKRQGMPVVKHTLLAAAVAATVGTSSSAWAQEEMMLEEVIVTVNRRAESLQDFAGTAQAFSADELAKSGVGSDFQNLQVVIPGLQISENEGFKEIYIRGIGTQSNLPGDDSATAVHLNGVYLPRSRGIGPMMYDLERVEANKGPQGTLRGRNATAGSINFITRKPEFDAMDGYLKGGFGTFDAQEFEGAFNLPITDTLAVRAAAYHREHEEYYDNALESFTAESVEGVGAEDEDAFRISLLWEPTEAFSALLTYDQADLEGTGLPGNYFGQAFSSGETVDGLSDPYDQHFLTEGKTTNEIEGFNLLLTYDFGGVIVEYNGGYREHDSFNRNSRRPFQFGVVNAAITSVDDILTADFNNFGTNHILDVSEAWVHEVRLYSPDDARLRWTVGLFSLDEEQSETRFDTSDRSLEQSSLGGESASNTDVEAFSVFADATFDVTDTLRVKAGVRQTEDDKSKVGFQAQYFMDFGPTVTADDVRFSTPGYEPTRPGDRNLFDPLDPNVNPTDFFLDGVGRFGGGDTLDELLAANPNAVTLTTSANGTQTNEFDETYIDWRAGVEYDLSENNMVYATVTTGSRSGGLNDIIVLADGNLAPSSFEREKLRSWELGSKNTFELNGMPVTFNANLFFYQYEDQVLQVAGVAAGGGFTPGATNVNANLITRNVNIGESEMLGLELDGGIAMPYGFNVGWNIAYLDSEYTDAIVADGRQNPEGALPPNVDISGNQLLNVSKYNAVIHFGQDVDMGWGAIDWRITASYRSKFYATPFEGKGFDLNGNEIPLDDVPTCCFDEVGNGSFYNDKVDGFTIFNVNAGVNFGSEQQFRVEGYVNNLTEQAYAQKQIINAFVNIAFLNAPRTGGVRFTWDF